MLLGYDEEEAVAVLRSVGTRSSSVTSQAEVLAELRHAPLVTAIGAWSAVLVFALFFLAAPAVLFTVFLGHAINGMQTSALLHLGTSRDQIRDASVVELVPRLAVAVVAGIGAGVASWWVVVGALDLGELSGGSASSVKMAVDVSTVVPFVTGVAMVAVLGSAIASVRSPGWPRQPRHVS